MHIEIENDIVYLVSGCGTMWIEMESVEQAEQAIKETDHEC